MIKSITNKGITYTDEFKYKLVKECENYKKFSQDVFRKCGIDLEVVGERRYANAADRWRKQFKETGEIKDSRKYSTGRSRIYELSDKEKIKRLEEENFELEYSKKLRTGVQARKNQQQKKK